MANYPLAPCSVTDISLVTSSHTVMLGLKEGKEVRILLYSRKKRRGSECLKELSSSPSAPRVRGFQN